MNPYALTRRNALLAHSATIVSPSVMAQQIKPVIRIQGMNNVRIAVSDLERSTIFYERLFGPARRQRDAAVFPIGNGPNFLALTAGGANPDFYSYGLSVADFDAERVMRSLADLGVSNAQMVRSGDTPELFVPDANGIRVQLQDTAYGATYSPAPAAAATSVFQLKSINHVTLNVANGARELEFYRTVFGLPIHHRQGNFVGLGIGEGREGWHVAFDEAANSPNSSSRINHVCFTIENFDAERIMAILIDHGLEPIESGIAAFPLSVINRKPMTCLVRWRQRANNGGGPTSPLGTPELYLTDPDNVAIQIQDVSYCGGSGRLGEICT